MSTRSYRSSPPSSYSPPPTQTSRRDTPTRARTYPLASPAGQCALVHYAPSNTSHSSAKSKRSSATYAISTTTYGDPAAPGYVPRMPPRDYFTSGASKRGEWPLVSAAAYGNSFAGSGKGQPNYGGRRWKMEYGYATPCESDEDESGDLDELGTILPEDSISQVSSEKSSKARRSAVSRSGRSSRGSGDTGYGSLRPRPYVPSVDGGSGGSPTGRRQYDVVTVIPAWA